MFSGQRNNTDSITPLGVNKTGEHENRDVLSAYIYRYSDSDSCQIKSEFIIVQYKHYKRI